MVMVVFGKSVLVWVVAEVGPVVVEVVVAMAVATGDSLNSVTVFKTSAASCVAILYCLT